MLDAWPGPLRPDRLDHINRPTPFLALHLPAIAARAEHIQAAVPGIELCYAVKCLPDPSVLATLAAAGVSFEIASFAELELVNDAGGTPARVSYSNPVKPIGQIAAAYAAGCGLFVADGPNELSKLAAAAPGCSVLLRVKVDDRASAFPLSSKFGAPLDHALALLRHARDLGLDPAGLTFHVGSQCSEPEAWAHAIDALTPILAAAADEGMPASVLDIGGGFPARYDAPTPPLEQFTQPMLASLARLDAEGLLPGRVLAEPGRALVAESAVLVTTVIGRESRQDGEWLYVDCGAYNGLMEAAQTHGRWPYPMRTRTGRPSDATATFTVTGPTCDSSDTLRRAVTLPADVAAGDRLYVGAAGAYSIAYGAAFNGFPVPDTVLV